MNISEDLILGQLMIGSLAYADEIAVLEDDMETVNILCKKLLEATGEVGLIINDEKTEYTKLNRGDNKL